MQVILTIFEKLGEGNILSPRTKDITDDLVSFPEISRFVTEDTFFSIEAGEINLTLDNSQYSYFGGSSVSPFRLKGSLLTDEGRHADTWRMERIQILEGSTLRFLGYVFADNTPITYSPDKNTVSFSVYDTTYILNLFKLSRPAYSTLGIDAIKHRERYIATLPVLGENKDQLELLHVLDHEAFQYLPREETVRWEKTYLLDSFGGFDRETNNTAYERIDLSEQSDILPIGTYGYRRKAASSPTPMSVYDDILKYTVDRFNDWSPVLFLSLDTTEDDIDFIDREAFVHLDEFPSPFDKLELYATSVGGSVDRVFAISFTNQGVSDDGAFQKVFVGEIVNRFTIHKIVEFTFPAFPPLPTEITLRLSKNQYVQMHPFVTIKLNPFDVEHKASVIRNPADTNIIYVWRMSKRICPYARYKVEHLGAIVDLGIVQHQFQYLKINIAENTVSEVFQKEEIRAKVSCVMYVALLDDNYNVIGYGWRNMPLDFPWSRQNWMDFSQLINPAKNTVILSEGEAANYYDSSMDPNWDREDRYYSPRTNGPGLFYVGVPALNAISLDYRDKTFGNLLIDLSILTNSVFYLGYKGPTECGLFFLRRDFSVNTLTIRADNLVNIDEELTRLLTEPIPTLSSNILDSDSANKVLSDFYQGYFSLMFRKYRIEVERGSLENVKFDVGWSLRQSNTNYGIIQKYTLRDMTVVFETLKSLPNSVLGRNSSDGKVVSGDHT